MKILHPIISVFLAILCGNQIHIHIPNIGIAHHDICFQNFSGYGFHSRCTLTHIINHDFFDLSAKLHLATYIFEDIHKTLHQCTHTAHRKPNSPSLLKNMNQGINGCCLKWISAYKQRMKTEYLTKSVIFDMLIHHARNRTLRTQ